VRGTIGELPFADGSFDVVTATGVLEYAELVPQALQELGRVLRPGGRAVVSVPNTGSLHALSRSLTDPVARTVNRIRTGREPRLARRDRIPRLEGLEHLLRDAGLEVTDVRHVAALVIPAPLDGLLPGA
jgi:ubiquinone/menaquinone biosynthesis C-methylase UbiE